MCNQPTFMIHTVPVYGDLILAPLAGFSDKPYRLICREYGSAMSYTEFVLAGSVLHANIRCDQAMDFDPSERPVAIQIFEADADQLEAAARKVEQLRPDVIDLNLGCSVPKVVKRGAGAGLLKDPARIAHILTRLTRAVSTPVTAKIRLGWDADSLNYLEVAKVVEDSGAAMIAVHARTQAQNYDQPANWDAIAEIKQALRIPVIGNGDVRSVADVERLKRHTGCDGVMVGRAAIGNPWIFQRRDLHQVSLDERLRMVHRHLDAMVDFYGMERGTLRFRKHMLKYLRALPNVGRLRGQLMACTRPEAFVAAIRAYEEERSYE